MHSTTNYNTGVISFDRPQFRQTEPPPAPTFPLFFSRPSNCQSFSQSNPQFGIGREIIPSSFWIDRSLLPSSALRRRTEGPKERTLRLRRLSSAALIFFSFLLPLLLQFAAPNSFSTNLQGVPQTRTSDSLFQYTRILTSQQCKVISKRLRESRLLITSGHYREFHTYF